jgi:hypothetical protein
LTLATLPSGSSVKVRTHQLALRGQSIAPRGVMLPVLSFTSTGEWVNRIISCHCRP